LGAIGSPLRFCLDECLSGLIHRFHELPEDEGIAIFIDRDENENLAREITEWHVDYYRHNDQVDDSNREITLAFGSDREFVPIQAADILANETYRYVMSGGEIPFIGASPVGGSDPYARPFIEAIKQYSFLTVTWFTGPMLKAVLDAKARGETRPDGRNPDAVIRQIILEEP